MNYLEFVFELRKLCPLYEDFKLLGYENETIIHRIKSYDCILSNDKPLANHIFANDEILRLLSYYDCTQLEIGVISFLREYQERASYFIIGQMEIDILIVNKITFEIQVLDYLDDEHVLYSCAANSSSFLESILLCAEFFSTRVKNPSLATNTEFTFNYLKNCIEKAGGEKYRNFYTVILGFE